MPLCSSPYADAQMMGLMGLTASDLAARLRRSARRRLAEARTTYSFAGALVEPKTWGPQCHLTRLQQGGGPELAPGALWLSCWDAMARWGPTR